MSSINQMLRLDFYKKNQQTVRIIFYSLWLVVNLLQAGFTNLIHDEAYYWVWSRFPGWGHFQHPPFNDILIIIGYYLIPNELGVRLFFVVLSTAGIYLMEKLLVRDDLILFYALFSSIIFFQIASIFAVHDIPLFFFTVTFYLLFREFITRNNWFITILLALNTALLLYSKYLGIIVIGFSFLYNIRLLIKKQHTIWWILFSLVFFLPHIMWQIKNGFPTVMFHLLERPGKGLFDWMNLLDYIPGQLLISGPIISFIIFLSLFKLKTEDRFQKTLLFNLLAMYAFFQVITVYHHIEANWTVVGIPPLIILGHKALHENKSLQKWVYRTLPFSLLLAITFRLLLIFPQWLGETRLDNELLGYDKWAKELTDIAGDSPVVFAEGYQRTSQFAFYSGNHTTFTLNPNKKSEFDFIDTEEKIQGRKVLFVSREKYHDKMELIETSRGRWYYAFVDNFRSFKKIRISAEMEKNESSIPMKTKFLLQLENPYPFPVDFLENETLPTKLGYIIFSNGRPFMKVENTLPATLFNEKHQVELDVYSVQPDYQIQFTLKTGWLPAVRVSRIYKLSDS